MICENRFNSALPYFPDVVYKYFWRLHQKYQTYFQYCRKIRHGINKPALLFFPLCKLLQDVGRVEIFMDVSFESKCLITNIVCQSFEYRTCQSKTDVGFALSKFLQPLLTAKYSLMAIRVVEFSNGGYKIRKIFA